MPEAKLSELRDKLGVSTPAELIPWINLLAYGKPGIGKTYLGGTACDDPRTSPVLILDVEGGTVTLRKRKVDVIRVESMKQLYDIIKELRLAGDKLEYKTVFLDSLTEMQKLDMEEVLKQMVNARPDLDPDVPSQREWGKSSVHVRRVVRYLRDLPCNTVLTALVTEEQREGSNRVRNFPNLPGKLKGEIPGFLDMVGLYFSHMEGDDLVRRLQFQETPTTVAKDRTATCLPWVDNPTIPVLWDRIHEQGESEK